MSEVSNATGNEFLTLSQDLQSLDEAFQNFEKNPPKPSEDSKSKQDFTTKIADIKTTLKGVKKQIGEINLDVQTDETKKIKEARQKLYATLDKTSKILNPMVTNKENDEIQEILDLIPSVKASILTTPQIDNPIRHGFSSTFSYEYLLASYNDMDISYNPIPPTNRITIGESKYVHSIFSEEIIRETGKVYQIRENLASCKISLGYTYIINYGKKIYTPPVILIMPHYIGDETTIPSDLQTMFKYVFWFQQKIRTCDLPFFPSVLTMMKLSNWDNNTALNTIIRTCNQITDSIQLHTVSVFINKTIPNLLLKKTVISNVLLTTEQLIKWIKYLEYYFDDCTKKIDTLPSIPVVDKELNDLKNKMVEQYKGIIGWASTTYTKLYEKLSKKQPSETTADAEQQPTPESKALTQFLKIIFFYKTHVKEQSDILFGIILDDEVRTVPLTDVEIIQNNLKKMTVCLDKYTTTEQIFGIFETQA